MTTSAIDPAEPTSGGTIPASPADVDATWLRAVLDLPVEEVRAESLGEGVGVMAQVSRLHLTYADGPGGDGDGRERPATLVLKTASPAEENRRTGVDYGFYRREVAFYREIAHRIDLRVPRCHHASMSEGTVPFAILLEEIVGARTVDQLEPGTVDDARALVDAIATLHARWWDAPELDELEWLPPVANDAYKAFVHVMPDLVPILRERYGERLEPEGFDVLDAMCERYPAYLDAWVEEGPLTFCHYDLRPDNLLFDPPTDPGSIVVLDWQLAVRHRGTFDLAYYLGQNVSPEFRRAHQDELLRRYHDALTGLGVTGYSFDRCWDDYRRGMLMHVVSALQLAVLDGGNERGQRLLDAMLTAGWTACVELDAAEFLGELAG